MKKILVTLLSVFFYNAGFAQLFHENFEFPDSITWSSFSSMGYGQNDQLSVSGIYCDSMQTDMPNSYVMTTTTSFSTIGINTVFLYFNHICKIEYFDNGIIEVSIDGGATWYSLVTNFGAPGFNSFYFGYAPFGPQNNRFQESSYPIWDPGNISVPLNSWWKREIFDLSPILANVSNAMIRFSVYDMNGNGPAGRAGWFIDDILVTDTLDMTLSPFLNRMTGFVFVDQNVNSVFDTGDSEISGMRISKPGFTSGGYSLYNGTYKIDLPDTGVVTIQPNTAFYDTTYYSVVPVTCSEYFPVFAQVDSLNDFAFQPLGVFDDLQIDIYRVFAFRPGFTGQYLIRCKNKGTTFLVPDITLYPDSALSYVSSTLAPAVITSDSITWNLPGLNPLEQDLIYITFEVDSTVGLGALLNTHCVINPVSGDASPLNNYDTVSVWTTASLDPNAIEVSDTVILSNQLSTAELEYTIYFQNTGNDTAFYVNIYNNLPPELDASTVEIIASSHSMTVSNNLIFTFNNILLPDSSTNEEESHGFVKYRVKPLTTLIAGDSISSFANIQFDFNLAVTTNTANTAVVDPLFVLTTPSSLTCKLYPNPSNDKIIMDATIDKGGELNIELFDVYGKRINSIFQDVVDQGQLHEIFDISNLACGIYLVRLSLGDAQQNLKFVKM